MVQSPRSDACRSDIVNALASLSEEEQPPDTVVDDEFLAAYELERPAGLFSLPARFGRETVDHLNEVFGRWFAVEVFVRYYTDDAGKQFCRLDEYETLPEDAVATSFGFYYSRFETLPEILVHRHCDHADSTDDVFSGVMFGYELESVASFCEENISVPAGSE